MKIDGSAKGNVKYLQSRSYMNIKDSDSLENCVEIYAHQDDWDLISDELEMLNLLAQKYGILYKVLRDKAFWNCKWSKIWWLSKRTSVSGLQVFW